MTYRVLVLGAGGYLGSRLLSRLNACSDFEAVGAGRRQPMARTETFRILDATDTSALKHELVNFDAVVNCVSGAPSSIAEGAKALRDAILSTCASRQTRVVHMSSMAVYGPAEGVICEDHPQILGDTNHYAGAKVLAEQSLAGLNEVVIFRPGCIYGKNSPQWTLRIKRLLKQGRIGDLGVNGDGCSNLVYVSDVLDAIVASLRTERIPQRAYNLAMPKAPSWNEYFKQMAYLLGTVPLPRITSRRMKLETRLLAPALHAGGIVGQRMGLKVNFPPVIPPSLLRLWRQDIRLDAGKATQDWLLRWTSLDAGLRQSLED